MKKLIKITQPNKIIYFKNRKVRTPVTLEVTDSDLKSLEIAFKMADIQDFEIVIENLNIKKQSDDEIINFDEDKEIIIEELEIEKDAPKTILERLMRNGEKEWK